MQSGDEGTGIVKAVKCRANVMVKKKVLRKIIELKKKIVKSTIVILVADHGLRVQDGKVNRQSQLF